eukprot:357381-Chlamydomonas_euryale.AAC.7
MLPIPHHVTWAVGLRQQRVVGGMHRCMNDGKGGGWGREYTPEDGKGGGWGREYTPGDGKGRGFGREYAPGDGKGRRWGREYMPASGASPAHCLTRHSVAWCFIVWRSAASAWVRPPVKLLSAHRPHSAVAGRSSAL